MDQTRQPSEDITNWKEAIKERWDKRRKHVILEGNGGIIYPTTYSPQYCTRQTHTSSVSLPTHGSGEREHNPGTEYAENLIKIIGFTIASLLAFLVISFILVWICRRRLSNKNERTSMGRPLQREDTCHIYAEVEPLPKIDVDSPSTNSIAVQLPTSVQTRWSGVRYVSDRLLSPNSGRSETVDSIFFIKQAQSVQFPPLPPVPDFPNRDRKDKMRAERQKFSSAPSSTSSDVLVEICKRENVYNPLIREADPAPYDRLKLGKTESGAHITDEGPPGPPHDYFVLEKENGENTQHVDKNSHPYFMLEKEDDSLDKDYASNPTELEGVDEGDCNTKLANVHSIPSKEKREIEKDHGCLVLESTASSKSLNHGKGSNALFEDNTGQASGKSSLQKHINKESFRDSYEILNNVSCLYDNQNHSDEKSLSTQSSSCLDKTRKGIRQSHVIQNYIWIESTELPEINYDNEASKSTIFAEDNSISEFKNCNSCSPNADTANQNTSSDDYMEPVKTKTLAEYIDIYPLVP